jgi:hypothetical protein
MEKMKYKNFKQIKNIVEQIEKHQRNLDALECQVDVLIVHSSGSGRIYTIGTDSQSEHEYKKPASNLIEIIRGDLKSRIENLKSILESL